MSRSNFLHQASYATLALALAALVLALPSTAQDAEMTLDELVAKNLEAKGGAAAWDAVDNAKVTAQMSLGESMQAPMVFYFARPDKMRSEFTIQGTTIIQAYDGDSGWQVMPLMGASEPQELGPDELAQLKRLDFFRGLLQTYEEQGYEATYHGIQEIEGTHAHEVEVRFDEEDSVTIYLDPDHYLEFLQVIEAVNPQTGQPMTIDVIFGDYEPVGDLMFAHSLALRPEGTPATQTITIQSIELDTDEIDDDLFAMPAPSAASTDEAGEAGDGGEAG